MARAAFDGDQTRGVSVRVQAPGPDAGPAGFRLMRYFTLATLVAFIAVALALFFLQRMEEQFFERVQREQAAFLADAQALLARQHEAAALSSLLEVNEASHVNLGRLVANMLWNNDIAPFVAAAQRLPIQACRALPTDPWPSVATAHPVTPPPASPRRDCFAKLGRDIMALPGFQALDAKAYAAMRASTVFKIKVFDLRGITVYSSEHAQIGEDAFDNQGWRSAAAGRPASELTHRDRFSAFERVVENRDLISTYVPLRAAGGDAVVGVFEIYADVTPFLGQIRAASRKFAEITAANELRVAQTGRANQDMLHASSGRFLAIVGGLLVLLYATSLLIVRFGQRIIDTHSLAQAQAAQREQLWHREKMAALATMAANVSHEVGNPLAVISGVAEQLAEPRAAASDTADAARRILEQTARIGRMTRRIADFAGARGEASERIDVNVMVKSVCDFLAFDRRFRATPIEFQPGAQLPAAQAIPDHLNDAVMQLLQAGVHAVPGRGPCARIRVQTALDRERIAIRVVCDAPAGAAVLFDQAQMAPLRRRIAAMGGQLEFTATSAQIALPMVREVLEPG
jgi:signal transduction histidine kinase